MYTHFRFANIFLCLLFLTITACHSGGSETPPSQEDDTRQEVKAAFDKVDKSKTLPIFNKEHAAIIKADMEKEQDPTKKLNFALAYANELLKSGQYKESINMFHTVVDFIAKNNYPVSTANRKILYSLIGIAFMRMGEIENCVQNHNHQSCFLPIQEGGVHTLRNGSENAIKQYQNLLHEFPDDLETKYLLNVAYMTLGEYPEGVPKEFLINPKWFENEQKITPFKDIAPDLGVNIYGHAGGVVIDDFTNDGWLDMVVTSWSPNEELVFFKNNGDGSFSDQTEAYGLKGLVGILNLNQTDFNNDGWLDLYLMRGAWLQNQGDIPNTLLENTGKGKFVDVTHRAGLTHVAPTQTSAWADYNLDGWIDVVIANESLPDFPRGIDLYINQKDGTFKHESTAYGLTLNQFFKGCVATDINHDKYPDIYFSALDNPNSLFINQGATGKNIFVESAQLAGVTKPDKSFPCWAFDYDNDGWEDIFVSSYTNDGTPAMHWMLSQMKKADPEMLPKLFHNNGDGTFTEKGQSMGLNEVAFTMGCNFGDINTDGFLDFYLATGNPLYQSIVPNKMYLNMDGQRFADVSYSGGFANIQKGHGVGFGDLDHDGDEDIYVVIGGAFDGDVFYNCLFENPNTDKNNWLILDLEGKEANRKAIGANVLVTVIENGKERRIARTITSGASFGANSLSLEIGLRKSTEIKSVNVVWPCRDCPDSDYTGLTINKAYKLTQGQSTPQQITYDAVQLGHAAGQMHEHMHH